MTPNMTPNAMTPCPLGTTEETLSAQRDELLGAAEARRLSEHVASCPACQARMQALDTLARTMQTQRVPDLQPTVWRGLQERVARERGRRSIGRPPRVGGLAAIAAVLLVALFATVLLSRRGNIIGPVAVTPTISATPIVTNWRPSTLTTPLCIGFFNVAPSDPRTLYASTCSTGHPAMAVTHDGGASWSNGGVLPGTGAGFISVDPTAAADLLYVDSTGTDQPITLYRSTDGGTHWKQLEGIGQLPFADLGWAGSTAILVLQQTGFNPATQVYRSLGGGPFDRIYPGTDLFGLNPNDYAIHILGSQDVTAYMMLVGASQSLAGQQVVLRTTDGGIHWAPVSLMDGAGQPVTLRQISSDGSVLVGTLGAVGTRHTFVSSTDDSTSWRPLPTLLGGATATGSNVFLVAPDGTLLVLVPSLPGSANLYELLPNAGAWRLLTVLPDAFLHLHTDHWDLLQWDAAGRPVALWSPSATPNPQTGGQLITLYMLSL